MGNEAIAIELLKIGFHTKFETVPLMKEEHRFADAQVKVLVNTYKKILNELDSKQS